MTYPTNEQQRVVGWFCDRDGKTVLTSGFVAENRAYVESHKDCNWRPLLHPEIVAELIEAHRASVDEIERLRDAMFRVYAVAANGGDTTPAIELMRDEMDKPWSVDRSRAALANVGSQP